MSFQYRAQNLTLAAILAMAPLASASPASAATDPAIACGQAIAKSVSKCVKKAVSVHAKCFKDTNADCADNDVDLTAAYVKLGDGVRSKCSSNTIVADAGYGPYIGSTLTVFMGDSCKWQADLVSDRTFGATGSNYALADADGRKCLQSAAKSASKFVTSSIGGLSKCLADGCTFDFSAGAASAQTAIDSKCPTFQTLVGTTSATYVASAMAQIPGSVASPCDPFDTTRCIFPFPNDYFSIPGASTPTGRHLVFGQKSMPKTGQTYVTPTRWNEADGFSIGAMLLVQDVNIDLGQTGTPPLTDMAKSLDSSSPVLLLDADTGDQQLFWMERDVRGATIADQPIIGRVGRNLKEGHRYIVAMRNMKDAGGAAVAAPASFALYRDNTPTTILPVEARRAHMEEILDFLTAHGVTRSELYLAWDFTTQSSESTAGRLLAMRDDAFDNILGSAAPAFTVDTVTNPGDGKVFRLVDGTFQVPNYLNDVNSGVGSTLRTDANLVPYNSGDYFTAEYRCVIPESAATAGAAPAIPARVSMYGHGLLGSHTEVDGGNIRDFAIEHNVIFCATDWTGFAGDDQVFVVGVVSDFSNFPTFIDRQHQGILNMMFLGRLLTHASGFAGNAAFQVGGQSMLDRSELFYDGNSQGGILGGVLAAFEQEATRLSLGVPGINYSSLLNRSVDFDDFDLLLQGAYPLSTDRNLLLSMSQLIWDRTDPSGHINHITSDPYENTPAKKVLYQVAFGDHQVAPLTAEVAARSTGALIHTPILVPGKVVPEVTPYYGLTGISSYPYDGSALVIWDAGNPAPPITNIPPANILPADPIYPTLSLCAQNGKGDPHSCPRKNVDSRTMKSEFLKTGGAVVDVCGGAACVIVP